MFQWLNEEDLISLSMAPGETRLQKLKFVLAFFAATVLAKRARDENEKAKVAVDSLTEENREAYATADYAPPRNP
jgi:hypothetical protein